MQLTFNMNLLALVDGQPQTLPLKSVLQHHVDHRREIVRRRTEFDLGKARARAHILEGLKIALDNLDAVIQTIRESADVELARTNLMLRFELSELQAQAILDLRLARLAALERKKIEDEYLSVIQLIAELEDILANPQRVLSIIKDELVDLKKKYAGERRTRVADDSSREMTDEDLIADEDVVVTISGRGYIKRQPVTTYRRQNRGGKGIIGHVTREEDAVEHLIVATTHDWALFFTNRGRVFSAKVHSIPDASRQAKGIPIINLPGVQVESGELPMATITLKDFTPGSYLVLATRQGKIKKTPLEQFDRVRLTGIRAITIDDGDELAWVDISTGDDDVIIATAQGKLARFHEDEVRAMGRDAAGVIGIRLARKGDSVVGMSVVQPDADLLVLSETGYGKRVSLGEFRVKHRGREGGVYADQFEIYHGNSNPDLARKICRYLGVEPGKAEVFQFANENIFVKILDNVREKDVFLVQPTCHPVNQSIMELLIMIDAFKRASAGRITAVIPFYAYGRSDKKDQPRVPITARLIADMVTVAGADRVLTMDLHQGQIQGFFNIPVDELTAVHMLSNYYKHKQIENPVVVTDLGFAKRARAFAELLDAPLAIIEKRRVGNLDRAELMNVIGDVKGKRAIIVDDEIDTAGTLVEITRALVREGVTA